MASNITEISPAQAHLRQRAGALLVDIREDGERAAGMADGAIGVSKAKLEENPSQWLPDVAAEIMLICALGGRSAQCSQSLQHLGYSRVYSVAGGTTFWEATGLPMTAPTADRDFLDRYARHLSLPEVGLEGQRKLATARIALIGAGGLGSPAALYLAAAGVGHISLIDDDIVERSNLQRQILHADTDVGCAKVESGRRAMQAINPRVEINAVQKRLNASNVEELLRGHDVVVDGSDNFTTRYLANDACVRLGLPMVYGAVQGFHGQVAVFWPTAQGGSCYRCLFPEPPPPEFAPNCVEGGVLGVLPGVVGLLQATEAIKLILHIGEPLSEALLRFDALHMHFDRLQLLRDPTCPSCSGTIQHNEYTEEISICASS
jgi:molybdopterin/thiamine biosynthesis adenylyltransferase/rhodanese-related sulfurtransferase